MEPEVLAPVNNASTYAALLGTWIASYDSIATQTAYRTDVRGYLAYTFDKPAAGLQAHGTDQVVTLLYALHDKGKLRMAAEDITPLALAKDSWSLDTPVRVPWIISATCLIDRAEPPLRPPVH